MFPLLISAAEIHLWDSNFLWKNTVWPNKTSRIILHFIKSNCGFNSMGSQGSWGAVPGLYFHSQWQKDWKDNNLCDLTETAPVLQTPSHPFFENFSWSFSSVFLLKKNPRDGELRDLFLLQEGVQGHRAKSTSLVTVFSGPGPREQVDSEPKKRLFAALSVSQALADISNMCETTSPSAQAALFNDVPLRGSSSTKHDRQHVWVWLPSVTNTLRGEKPQHCHRCGPLLFRRAEEPSDSPQLFHSHASLSFFSLFPV